MNIVAITGSPKKTGAGNAIVKKIEAGMKVRGSVEFIYLFLL